MIVVTAITYTFAKHFLCVVSYVRSASVSDLGQYWTVFASCPSVVAVARNQLKNNTCRCQVLCIQCS